MGEMSTGNLSDNLPQPVGLGRRMAVEPLFQTRSFSPDPKLCFVLMPIGQPRLDTIYQEVVRPAIVQAGLNPVRADEILGTAAIIEDIWSSIYNSRLVVAELTGHNPNVYYELGIAHTIGRDVVPISQASTVFDIGHIRHILYQDNASGLEVLQQKLRGTIEVVLAQSAT